MKNLSPVRDALARHRNVEFEPLIRAMINHPGWIVPLVVMQEQHGVNVSHVFVPESGDPARFPPDAMPLYTDLDAVNESKAKQLAVPSCMGGIAGSLLFSKLDRRWSEIWINPGSETTACTILRAGYDWAEEYAQLLGYEERLATVWERKDDTALAEALRAKEQTLWMIVQENGIILSATTSRGLAWMIFTAPDCAEAAVRAHGSGVLKNCKRGTMTGAHVAAAIDRLDDFHGVIVNYYGPGPHVQYWWKQGTPPPVPPGVPGVPTERSAPAAPPGRLGDSTARQRDEYGRRVLREVANTRRPLVLYLRSYGETVRYGKSNDEGYLIEEYLADRAPAGVNTLSVQIPTAEGKLTDVVYNRNTPALMLGDDWADVVRDLLDHADMVVCECLRMSSGVERELQMIVETGRCDHTALLLPPPATHVPTLDHHRLVKHFPRCVWVNEFYNRELFECPAVADLVRRVEQLAQLPPAELAAVPPGERHALFAPPGERLETVYAAEVNATALTDVFADQDPPDPETYDSTRHYALWTRYRALRHALRQIGAGEQGLARYFNFVIAMCLDTGKLLGSVRLMSERKLPGSIQISRDMPGWALESLAQLRAAGLEPVPSSPIVPSHGEPRGRKPGPRSQSRVLVLAPAPALPPRLTARYPAPMRPFRTLAFVLAIIGLVAAAIYVIAASCRESNAFRSAFGSINTRLSPHASLPPSRARLRPRVRRAPGNALRRRVLRDGGPQASPNRQSMEPCAEAVRQGDTGIPVRG
jgi:hypothetical protein